MRNKNFIVLICVFFLFTGCSNSNKVENIHAVPDEDKQEEVLTDTGQSSENKNIAEEKIPEVDNYPLQYSKDGKLDYQSGHIFCAESDTVMYITNDNKVSFCGDIYIPDECKDEISTWNNITYVGGSSYYAAAIDKDNVGYVVDLRPLGDNTTVKYDDVKSIKFSDLDGAIVKNDGTVEMIECFQDEDFTQERIDEIQSWTDIVKVDFCKNINLSESAPNIVGLKNDGTVVCLSEYADEFDLSEFSDIIDISAGYRTVYGLKADGTVVAAKNIDTYIDSEIDVSNWKNVCMIAAGRGFVVGLKDDGTVYYSGNEYSNEQECTKWNNIIAIDASYKMIYGVCDSGKLIVIGFRHGDVGILIRTTDSSGNDTPMGLIEISEHKDFKLPNNIELREEDKEYPIGYSGPSLENCIKEITGTDYKCEFEGCSNDADYSITGFFDTKRYCTQHMKELIH